MQKCLYIENVLVPSTASTPMAIVFFIDALTARTTSAKYGMSKEIILMSVRRAKIKKLFIAVIQERTIMKDSFNKQV